MMAQVARVYWFSPHGNINYIQTFAGANDAKDVIQAELDDASRRGYETKWDARGASIKGQGHAKWLLIAKIELASSAESDDSVRDDDRKE